MYDWLQVKIRSEKNFQKIDVYVKHHKSENTLFSTIFKIMSLDIILQIFSKPLIRCLCKFYDWSQVKITEEFSKIRCLCETL